MTNKDGISVEGGLDPDRELRLLYNHINDDSRQFTREQMYVAIKHGHRLALSEREAAKDAEIARLRDVLRSIAETQWDSGAADACVAMIRSDARAALTQGKE